MTTVKSSLLSLVFTDLVDSTAFKMQLGDHKAGELIERHQERVRALTVETGGREVEHAEPAEPLLRSAREAGLQKRAAIRAGVSGQRDRPDTSSTLACLVSCPAAARSSGGRRCPVVHTELRVVVGHSTASRRWPLLTAIAVLLALTVSHSLAQAEAFRSSQPVRLEH